MRETSVFFLPGLLFARNCVAFQQRCCTVDSLDRALWIWFL